MSFQSPTSSGTVELAELIRLLFSQFDISSLNLVLNAWLRENALCDHCEILLCLPQETFRLDDLSGYNSWPVCAGVQRKSFMWRAGCCSPGSGSGTKLCRMFMTVRVPLRLQPYPSVDHCIRLPLMSACGLTGFCGFRRRKSQSWNEQTYAMLRTVAEVVSVVTDRIISRLTCQRKRERLHREHDELHLLTLITQDVLSSAGLPEMLRTLAGRFQNHPGIRGLTLTLNAQRGRAFTEYHVICHEQQSPAQVCEKAVLPGEAVRRVMRWSRPIVIAAGDDSEPVNESSTHRCLLPLMFGDRTEGVLTLCLSEWGGDEDLRFYNLVALRVAAGVNKFLAGQARGGQCSRAVSSGRRRVEPLIPVGTPDGHILTCSEHMRAVIRQASVVAQSDTTVLLLGETGTGKECVARLIHQMSRRHARRLVTVNCSSLPVGLMESMLFGHERGAFTGAVQRHTGYFEQAHAGTLFLDEVGDMPVDLQPKLLRVLQEREFERVGGHHIVKTDIRLIAATNRDLETMLATRAFRSDLYYRLNVFPLKLPPLRERREDIPLLAKYFASQFARKMGRNIECIPVKVLRTLTDMDWPGNVRELANMMERAVLLTCGTELELPPATNAFRSVKKAACMETGEKIQAEAERIRAMLKTTNGIVAGPKGAANRLGIKRTTLLYRMKRLGIENRGRG